jgi:TPP-dependent pyruvate/acetoin dehydrogenase alpha subunit
MAINYPHFIDDERRFLQSMQFLRSCEEHLADRYAEQEMRTPTHFGIGQEAIAVGVCSHLRSTDSVFSHHRAHNHYLASGGDLYALAAELYGRADGCSGGWGGSVHLTSRHTGFIASTAILGQSAPLACGAALSHSLDGSDNVGVCFFGDAAMEEGALYECLNFAALKRLPVLFVCENNGLSTESPPHVRQPEGKSLWQRAEAFGIAVETGDGNEIREVSAIAERAVARARNGGGATFLELETYRWLEHVGPNFDWQFDRPFRSKEEQETGMRQCPITREKNALESAGMINADESDQMLKDITSFVKTEVERARNASPPCFKENFQ